MGSVLLVEDNPVDAERVSRFLDRQRDLTLRVAASGAQALDLLQAERFSHLLLDYRLPDTNGLELLQLIRKRFPAVKVVFLTGNDDERLFLGAWTLGVVACVAKDQLTANLLLDLLRTTGGRPHAESVPASSAPRMGLPSLEVYQTLIETMNEGVVVTDLQHVMVFANPKMGRIAGCEAADLLGRPVISLLSPSSVAVYLDRWSRVARGVTTRYECEITAADRVLTPVLISQTPSYRAGGKLSGSLLVVTDIRGQKAIEKRLEQLSITDALTGVFNRRHFQMLLEIEFREAARYRRPLSCLMIDLDHFKACNDTWGHPFGDHVLCEVGRLVRPEIREHDILARYGGDEFVLLLPNVGEQGAVEAAERIRGAIAAHPFFWAEQGHRVTASIGVASTEDGPMASCDDVIRAADQALYRAKHGGRNRSAGETALPTPTPLGDPAPP